MKIMQSNTITSNVSFKAGRSILFSDFDGTLLAQPLHDIYSASEETKKESVRKFNSYFQDIQNFIDNLKGKFEINITTGRRLDNDNGRGFNPTYTRARKEGIKFPKINSLITSNGADVYHFNQDGTINTTCDIVKAQQIKDASGWDNGEIKSALDEIAKELDTQYFFADKKGDYKLSIILSNNKKLEEFYKKLQDSLNGKMKLDMNIADVKVGDSTKMTGIKLQPKIDGHHIHKDFDVKLALKNAIKNDDLVIFAGNADNDKEALNIFNYASKQAQWKIPYEAHEINPDYVKAVKSEIDSLPIKILFVEPPINEMDPKILSLADFMKKTSELFPEKVEIIKQTEIGKNNNFLDSIKNAIKSYSNQNLAFAKNFNTKLYLKILAKKLAPIFAGITMASGIVLACSDTLKTKQKKHNS